MSDTDLQLITESLELIAETNEDPSVPFYAEFFRRHPETRKLFSKYSESAQMRMFNATVTSVIERLEGARWVDSVLATYRVDHHAFEVEPKMYDWYVDCMLDVFRNLSDERWRSDYDLAWRRALAPVLEQMRAPV